MERKVRRERKLPSFHITLGELDSLMNKLLPLFDKELIYCYMSVELKNEEITFKSVDEMREFKGLPDYIASLSIFISDGVRSLSMYPPFFASPQPRLKVESDNEAWCAGTIEVFYQFAQPYRRWYDRIYGWPITTLFFICPFIPFILKRTESTLNIYNSFVFNIVWPSGVVLIAVLFFSRHRVLPGAVVVTTSKESLWRRYAPEIMIIIAILSLLVSVAGLFIRK